jgi:phosphatidylserine decarboxylase
MTLTPYGRCEEIVCPLIVLVAALVLCWLWPAACPWALIAAAVVGLMILAFFRDPERQVPSEPGILLAPADGKITDITEVEQVEYIKGEALRIGIFLSVFDVHLNRAPCDGVVRYIQRHPGKCLNAMRAEAASAQNEANSVGMECPEHPAGTILVKQITGAIARRIVCGCEVGDALTAGERFGMIKFGSRTELFMPKNERAEILVKKGDTVRAGTTIMVRYKSE